MSRRSAAQRKWRRGLASQALCSQRARARARLTYGPPCSSPQLVRARGAPGGLGTHPEAAPGEAPNLAPSARNGRVCVTEIADSD